MFCRQNILREADRKPGEVLARAGSPEQKSTPRVIRLYLGSSNPGKLKEFRALAQDAPTPVEVAPLPGIETIPEYKEKAETFGENALGKALYYSRHANEAVICDDSGLVVTALGGKPGVHSARYAGPNATNEQRIEKLLAALRGKAGKEREARFLCVIALAKQGRAIAVVSERVDGMILEAPRGGAGFGYDPVFYFPPLNRSFAELAPEEKNRHSHRGKAFVRLLAAVREML